MRKLLFITLALTSFCALARPWEDYVCSVRQYTVEITITQDTSTSYWLLDRHQVLSLAYAAWVERHGDKTTYHFYPGSGDNAKITFRTKDTIEQPKTLIGWIDTTANGFLLWDKLICGKVR